MEVRIFVSLKVGLVFCGSWVARHFCSMPKGSATGLL
jgi:hypothetical protein